MDQRQAQVTQMRIMDVRRLLNTPSGNPRYKLIGRLGSVETAPDSQVGFDVQDYVPDVGSPAKLTLNRSGQVIGIEYL